MSTSPILAVNELTGLIISSAAQARIRFMKNFEQAYEANAIRVHIDYVVNFLITARRSTKDAQDAFDGMGILSLSNDHK